MRYVIIRDDDTNALTPVMCLERLYRPFLDRGLPINLATIPEVATDATRADGRLEGFLLQHGSGETPKRTTIPLASNQPLVSYLRENPGYHIVQHGCHHDYHEFDRTIPSEIGRRLEYGAQRLLDAGFPRPNTFVAPYDKLSRASLREVSRRFRVLSTGWYELRRLPYTWWPQYAVKKFSGAPHWHIGRTLLLSHPGCLLSCDRAYDTMLGGIIKALETRQLTVLVTHWWEYFRNDQPDEAFIGFLHETANYLAARPDLKVISFQELGTANYRLN